MNEKVLSFIDENGNVMNKDEFIMAMSDAYDEMVNDYMVDDSDSYVEQMKRKPINLEEITETIDFNERHLFITDEITPEMANAIFELIKIWNLSDDRDEIEEDERTPIQLYINTPGGDLTSTFTIIDAIKLSKTPVYTYTIGTGYSGGFFIGICGHKRYGYPHSSYCFHEGSAQDGGDAHKFIQKVDFYKKQLDILKKITLNNTLIDEEEYENKYKDDWFMTAEEALENGVIDEIKEDLF